MSEEMSEQVTIIDDIPIFGTAVDDGALAQIKNCKKDAEFCALMADHHKGYAVPIGGVVAYKDKISPSGVGYDIACGNKAVLLDMSASEAKRNIKTIMDDIWSNISFGVGRKNKTVVDHKLFESDTWKHDAVKDLKQLAQDQLGTIGSGNHYVDVFSDEQDRVWIGCHFGSRGLGHKTATYFLNKAGASDGIDVDPCILDVHSEIGQDYLACMHLAGDYAYAGRDWVCAEVARLLGANILDEVHNHHNFAWHENGLWVVRKGATPNFPNERGFVGGSMGDISVIIEGVDNEENKLTLNSTVHGAGRVMGRKEAAGSFRWKRVEEGKPKQQVQVREGKISKQMMLDWITPLGVELRGAGCDESPHCYKRLPEVLECHKNSIRILHTLTPLGVAMAGENEFDPYKD